MTKPTLPRGGHVPQASGALIGESLRVGAAIERVPLVIRRIVRADVGDTSSGQPLTWTFLEFEIDVVHTADLADQLQEALDPTLGWYCDFRSPEETFVVFSGRIFRYGRGNLEGRREVEDYARSVGVPDHQLDWPE